MNTSSDLVPSSGRARDNFAALVRQSRRGGIIAAFLALILVYSERSSLQGPWQASLLTCCLVAAVARLVLARQIGRASEVDSTRRLLYHLAVIATALGWGVCSAAIVHQCNADSTLLTVMLTAGLAAGGTTTLMAELWLVRTYLVILVVPMALVLSVGDRSNRAWLCASMLAFLAYLLAHAQSLHSGFIKAREDGELLARRALRLEDERARAAEAQQGADQANRAKSAFLANMSHELRTPLTSIIGYAEQLLLPTDQGTRVSHAEVIRRNGVHLLEILNDVLDLSKIEAGRMSVVARPFSLRDLLLDTTSLMRPRAVLKGLRFELLLESPLPRELTADAMRVRQILFNLVGNALKFTDHGGVSLKARFDHRLLRLFVSVVDTGPGLSLASQQLLFLPFTQADDSTSRTHQGTGLGLYISREFARLMGGDVHIESTFGLGSTFTLELPVMSADALSLIGPAHDSSPPPRPHVQPSDDRPLLGAHLLLAEDGLDNQRLIAAILRRAGATVDVADDGEAAVQAAQRALASRPYDVVLMDMEMPKLDGYGATARLRAESYSLPIIALTAHAMDTHRARSLASGCDDHLVKPIDRAALLHAVRIRLGRPRGYGTSL